MAQSRIQYFDILKGLAIFLVVMGHVLTMCIREIDNALLFKLIERTHMPVFFFVSGYFTYKSVGGKDFISPRLGQRAIQLLIPFFVVSTLWILYYPHSGLNSPLDSSFTGLYSSEFKNGYWFTLVLFEIILLYSFLCLVLRQVGKWGSIVASLLAVGLVCFAVCALPESLFSTLSLSLLLQFLPIFLIGVFARKFKDSFDSLINNKLVYSIFLIVFPFAFYLNAYPWEFEFMNDSFVLLSQWLAQICVVYILIAIVRQLTESTYKKFESGTKMSRVLSFLGKESLGVYLLHYFFLFPLTAMQTPLREMGLGLCPTLVVSVLVALIIVTVTLGVIHIISKSNILSLLILGKNNFLKK